MPERVIVYRSRSGMELDKMLWEGDGTIGLVFGWLIVWVAVFASLSVISEKYRYKMNKKVYSKINFINFAVSLPLTFGLGKLIGKLIMAF